MKIDGKSKVLGNRKYCLSCSPYNQHNNKRLDIESIRVCSVCGREYEYARGKGHTFQKCNSCLVNQRKQERKAQAIEYKGSKCALCGYGRCHAALHFHHVNDEDKLFGISGKHALSWSKIKQELDKCVLLCANCHAEVHAGISIIDS
jgi:hypothetical protein